MPIDYDEYNTSAGLRFNWAWIPATSGTGWKLYRGLSSAGFSQRFAENCAEDRMLAFDSLQRLGPPGRLHPQNLDREHQRPRVT